jgi:hypothetical protein
MFSFSKMITVAASLVAFSSQYAAVASKHDFEEPPIDGRKSPSKQYRKDNAEVADSKARVGHREDDEEIGRIANDIIDVVRASLVAENSYEQDLEAKISRGVKNILQQLDDVHSARRASELLKRYPVAIFTAANLFDECGLQGVIECSTKYEDRDKVDMAFTVLFEHAETACKGFTIRHAPAHFINSLFGLKDREAMVGLCRAAETFDSFLYEGGLVPTPAEVIEELLEVNDAQRFIAISQALKDLSTDLGLVVQGGAALDETDISWLIIYLTNLKQTASINPICQSIRLNAVKLIAPAVAVHDKVKVIIPLIRIGCPEKIRERCQEVLALVEPLFQVAPAMRGIYSTPVILAAIDMFGEHRDLPWVSDAFRRAVLECQRLTLSSENTINQYLLKFTGDDSDSYAQNGRLDMSSQEDLVAFFQNYSATCMRGGDQDETKFCLDGLGTVFAFDLINQIRDFLKVFPDEEIDPYIQNLAYATKGNFDLDKARTYEIGLRKIVDQNRKLVEDRCYGTCSEVRVAAEQLVNLGYYADINFCYLLSNTKSQSVSPDLLVRSAAVCLAWQARLDKFKREHPIVNLIPVNLKSGRNN